MIALSIATTWLTLTAAGFAGLSALDRPGADGGDQLQSTVSGSSTPPDTSSDQSIVLADTRSLIARTLSD